MPRTILPSVTLLGNGHDPMKLLSARLDGLSPFKPGIEIEFDPRVNVICGENGLGKSRFFEAIADAGQSISWGHGQGHVVHNGFSFMFSHPGNIVVIGTSRENHFSPASGIGRYDSMIPHDNLQQWFVNLENTLARDWPVRANSEANFRSFQEDFSLLHPEMRLQEVTDQQRVIVSMPSGQVTQDQLSSGYQSYLSLIFSVLSKVELREDNIPLGDFNGILLIDEIDLHLHPIWQGKILDTLQALLPKTQIIATTHSPHVLQNLSAHQIIPLVTDAEGQTVIRSLSPAPGPYGFQGWTIEEILRDVMGVSDDRSPLLISTVRDFKSAVKDRNVIAATPPFQQLMQMLHPNNDLRVMYQMEFEAIGGQA